MQPSLKGNNGHIYKGFLACAFFAALTLQFVEAASSAPFDIRGFLNFNGGYESNIFRRPDVMDTGTGKYTPIESDAVTWCASRLNLLYAANSRNALGFVLNGDFNVFPKHMKANEGRMEGALDYRYRPLKPLCLALAGNGGYFQRRAIDETADETVDLYKYWQYGAGPKIEYKPTKSFSIDGGYQFMARDYEKPDSGQSLDNQQHEITIAIAPRFGRARSNTITLEGSYIFKKYRELLSYNANAVQAPGYPLRTYHYYTFSLGYKHDFGAVTWDICERPRYRADAFADFYTYFENRVSSGCSFRFSKKTKASLDGAWRYRYYTVHEAKRLGVNPNLVMKYVDVNAGFQQKLWKKLFLTAEYNLILRTTNTGYLSYTTYRDYTDHVLKGGVRTEW